MDEETNLINYQIYLSIFSIITILISISLLYNDNLLRGKKKNIIYTEEEALKISRFNRLSILIILFLFLVINSKLYKYADDKELAKMQISASIFSVLAALIALYVVYADGYEPVTDVENPII